MFFFHRIPPSALCESTAPKLKLCKRENWMYGWRAPDLSFDSQGEVGWQDESSPVFTFHKAKSRFFCQLLGPESAAAVSQPHGLPKISHHSRLRYGGVTLLRYDWYAPPLHLPIKKNQVAVRVTGSVLADAAPTYQSPDVIWGMQISFSRRFRKRLPFLIRHRQPLKQTFSPNLLRRSAARSARAFSRDRSGCSRLSLVRLR